MQLAFAMKNSHNPNSRFNIRDCALVRLSTRLRVQTLRELRDALERVPPGSVYHHFWGRFLQPQFDEPEYNNDFAAWAYRCLHEKALAEKLSVIDPTEYEDIEGLRLELLERVEDYLFENESVIWSKTDEQFYFVQSQLMVLDTGKCMVHPRELVTNLPEMSLGSIFYHFIDARRRTEQKTDDFSIWLEAFGPAYNALAAALRSIDPYFSSLKAIRGTLAQECENFFHG